MTTKETESELTEILRYKFALTGKINHNTQRVSLLENASQGEYDEDYLAYLAAEIKKGNKLIKHQITERMKYSGEKIATMLGIKWHAVRRQARALGFV